MLYLLDVLCHIFKGTWDARSGLFKGIFHHLSHRRLDFILIEVGRDELSFKALMVFTPSQKSGLTGWVNEEKAIVQYSDLVQRETQVKLLVNMHFLST